MGEQMSPQFGIAKRFRFKSIQELMQEQETLDVNKEGFVVTFDSGMRIKFKGKEYLAMAKLVQGVNEKMVCRVIIEDGLTEKALLNTVPEEFHTQISEWYKRIWGALLEECRNVAHDLIATRHMSNKELGQWVKRRSKGDGDGDAIVLTTKLKPSILFYARKIIDIDSNDEDLDVMIETMI